MEVEGKEATVTGVPAPGLTLCRVTTTVSPVKQRKILTTEKETAFFTSSRGWSRHPSMKSSVASGKSWVGVSMEDVAGALQEPTGLQYWG